MKKKITTILILATIAIMLVPGAFAWFSDNSSADLHITSYLHKSYFESGDGTTASQYAGSSLEDDSGCAFEIKYPIQFYYFSWLQYLGYFNQAKTEEGHTSEIDQVYFYLSADIDMTGFVLPPVGTVEFPFLGNFDGNGHTISNLTVQNVASSNLSGETTTLTDVPEAIGAVEIVGVFGVVGSTGTKGQANASQESAGDFISTSNYEFTYDTDVNKIVNFKLDTVTLIANADSEKALIGAVAGYLNAPAENADVVGDGATLVIASGTTAVTSRDNISDYSVVGYYNDDLSSSYTSYAEMATGIDEAHSLATALGGGGPEAGDDWGGSINFQSLNIRLYSLLNKNLTNFNSKGASTSALNNYVTGNAVQTSYGNSYYYHRYYADSYNYISVNRSSSSNTYYSNNPQTNDVIYLLNGISQVRASAKESANQTRPLMTVPVTILPLAVDENDNFTTLPGNTGYIVAGVSGGTTDNYSERTTVRSAAYSITRIKESLYSNTYVDSELEILTNSTIAYNASNFARIKDSRNSANPNVTDALSDYDRTIEESNLKKYTKSRAELGNVLNGKSRVHGLHFMGNAVTKNNKVTLPTAYINDETKTSYELPQSCIDFNLKEKGFINFFAGTYYGGAPAVIDGEPVETIVDSFFSLYKIERNGNSLNTVTKIEKIYKDKQADDEDNPYVYYYGGTDSYASNTSRYELVFDMQYLEGPPPVNNALYYFEIPVNSGEYALGSVVNTNRGAYLIYLDIGASGGGEEQVVTPGTSLVETITQTTYHYGYVPGVGVTAAGAQDGVAAETISSPVASDLTKTLTYSDMTEVGYFIRPPGDTVTDSAAVVKYLGKTVVITQRTTMTGTVNGNPTTIIVTKTTTLTYNASDALTNTVNAISATENGVSMDSPPTGFEASTLSPPAEPEVSFRFYNAAGGITVTAFGTNATITDDEITVTEYTVTTSSGVEAEVVTLPGGASLSVNGDSVAP